MLERKLQSVKIIRLSFLCFIVLGILFITNEHNPTVTAQQNKWMVTLEEGKTASSTLTLNNRCSQPHRFRLEEKMKYLSFNEPTESILVAPGTSKPVGVTFNTTGVKPGKYEDDIDIICLDCKKEKTCKQDKDKHPVQLTVTKPALSQGTSGLEAMGLKKKCRCVASTTGWSNPNVYDYGIIAEYPIFDVFAPRKCSEACSILVSGKNSIGDATAMCAKTGWAGGCVHGYGYIGNVGWNNADGTAGKLVCTAPVAAVTKQKCPAGWHCNACSPSVDGGFTNDGKCKKGAGCGGNNGINIFPLPPDGTQIGTWGFTWGNGIYAWGTAANGGAPSTVVISPAVAGSGSWSTCP